MAMYSCPSCGAGVSSGERHICVKVNGYGNLFIKPVGEDVPEHIRNYGRNKVVYTVSDKNFKAWY